MSVFPFLEKYRILEFHTYYETKKCIWTWRKGEYPAKRRSNFFAIFELDNFDAWFLKKEHLSNLLKYQTRY